MNQLHPEDRHWESREAMAGPWRLRPVARLMSLPLCVAFAAFIPLPWATDSLKSDRLPAPARGHAFQRAKGSQGCVMRLLLLRDLQAAYSSSDDCGRISRNGLCVGSDKQGGLLRAVFRLNGGCVCELTGTRLIRPACRGHFLCSVSPCMGLQSAGTPCECALDVVLNISSSLQMSASFCCCLCMLAQQIGTTEHICTFQHVILPLQEIYALSLSLFPGMQHMATADRGFSRKCHYPAHAVALAGAKNQSQIIFMMPFQQVCSCSSGLEVDPRKRTQRM